MKSVLFVLTSHDALGATAHKTGFWMEEFAAPYYTLADKGIDVVIASPKGGQPPVDPKSENLEAGTPATKRFEGDTETQQKLAHTVMLSNVKETDFDAVFFPGGHGPLWDLANDINAIHLAEAFYGNNKPVAAVCHGLAALRYAKNTLGEPLVKGKKVTGFSNREEAVVQLTGIVPFSVEDMLKENGGDYNKAADWLPYAIQDGLLITGQNPASSELVAEKLSLLLGK